MLTIQTGNAKAAACAGSLTYAWLPVHRQVMWLPGQVWRWRRQKKHSKLLPSIRRGH